MFEGRIVGRIYENELQKKKKKKKKNIKIKKYFIDEKVINTKGDTIVCLKAG